MRLAFIESIIDGQREIANRQKRNLGSERRNRLRDKLCVKANQTPNESKSNKKLNV
jgi:hypothetical protein